MGCRTAPHLVDKDYSGDDVVLAGDSRYRAGLSGFRFRPDGTLCFGGTPPRGWSRERVAAAGQVQALSLTRQTAASGRPTFDDAMCSGHCRCFGGTPWSPGQSLHGSMSFSSTRHKTPATVFPRGGEPMTARDLTRGIGQAEDRDSLVEAIERIRAGAGGQAAGAAARLAGSLRRAPRLSDRLAFRGAGRSSARDLDRDPGVGRPAPAGRDRPVGGVDHRS
jgi:hypothetical protein